MSVNEHRVGVWDELVEVVLEGGPREIPRIMKVAGDASEDRIKIPWGNGYEHFELDEPASNGVPKRFRWTMRTCIAE